MASYKELELMSRSGKLARGVLGAVLLTVAAAPLTCFARPDQQPSGRLQFEKVQQGHLGPWLQRHSNLPPQEQERALESEPGFNRLPAETQQKLLDRLRQINRMPPNQRQRTVDRIEAMERLSPQMRQQVRSSVQQFHALPEDRQRLMKKAFRDLREYPAEQRQALMNSGQFQAQFTAQERGILGSILSVEPYQPIDPRQNKGLEYGH